MVVFMIFVFECKRLGHHECMASDFITQAAINKAET